MTSFTRLFLAGLAVATALAILPQDARANSERMCNAILPGQGGSRTIGGTNSPVPSQTLYTLDSRGCTIVAQQDIGYFASQGFIQPGSLQSIVFTTGVLTGTTAVQMPSLPPSSYIREIIVDNSTANAVTGGIDIGTTSGAADVVSALTCGANCLTFVADSALLKRVFSKTAQQALFVLGHTAGNSSNLNITVVIGYF